MLPSRIIYFLSFFLLLFQSLNTSAQNAAERSAPFTAVKWLQDNPYVMIDGEWYLLVMIDNTSAKELVDFCKKNHKVTWQKRVSEDLAEMFVEMGKPLKSTVKLKLIKDGKTIDKTLEMTTDNRRKVRAYNDQVAGDTTSTKTQKEVVDKVQKDVAPTVNIKNQGLYKFKSAKFEFNLTGHKLYSGTETVYVADSGKTVIVTSVKPNSPMPENNTMIWKANQCTVINHLKKTYYITPVRPKATEPPVIAYSTPEQRTQGGYTKKSNETVLGKDCEVFEHNKMKVTYWLWKGYELKLINYSMGGTLGYTKEPKTVEENITIPESLFQIPDGYKKQ